MSLDVTVDPMIIYPGANEPPGCAPSPFLEIIHGNSSINDHMGHFPHRYGMRWFINPVHQISTC